MAPTAKEYTSKRLREFGESLLDGYELLLAEHLKKVQEDLQWSDMGC